MFKGGQKQSIQVGLGSKRALFNSNHTTSRMPIDLKIWGFGAADGSDGSNGAPGEFIMKTA